MPAVIDVGSHTIRLLIADLVDESLAVRSYRHVVTHLGRGVAEHHELSDEAMEATLVALESFSATLTTFNQKQVRVVGTEALRVARNRDQFIGQVKQRTGLNLEILNGCEEALTMAQGVLHVLCPSPHKALIFDIGGASTEFVCVDEGKLLFHRSYPIGVVSLCDSTDSQALMERCGYVLQEDLKACGLWPDVCQNEWSLVGTAGTVTTLAATQMGMTLYRPEEINNFPLRDEQLETLSQRLAPLSCEERERLPGIESGRGETIFAGVLFVRFILSVLRHSEMTVSDAGLMQGVFLSTWGQRPLLSAAD